MKDKNIGSIFEEWLIYRKNTPDASIEEFMFKKYMEFHKEDPGNQMEQETAFRKLLREWENSQRAFEKYVKDYPDSPELEAWQGTEMLENVIFELDMDFTEKYRYVLNVRQLIYDKLLALMDKESGKKLRTLLEQEYEELWEEAKETATDSNFQDLFSETVSLMRYAGLSYDDETRQILAEIGVGRQAEFQDSSMEAIGKDARFLMNFLISEMVVSEADEKYTREELNVITGQVVPVCVSSVSMVQKNEAAGHSMKLAYSYLGRLFSEKNLKLLTKVAAIFLAAKVLFFLFKLAVLGSVASIGLCSLWRHCKKTLNLHTDGEFLKSLFEKKQMQNSQKQDAGAVEAFRTENFEESIDEEVYEDA